jgi:hypothetical protein
MSITSRIPDWEKNSSRYTEGLRKLKNDELELLMDWYRLYDPPQFRDEIEAIKEELAFRNTLLGKELY